MGKKKGNGNGSGMDGKGKGSGDKAASGLGGSKEELHKLVQSAVDKAVSRVQRPNTPHSVPNGSKIPADRKALHKTISNTLRQALLKGGSGPLGPDRNPYSGGSVGKGTPQNKSGVDESFVYSIAHALTDAIFGETPTERLQRGHNTAEARAEKQIVQALEKNKGPTAKLATAMNTTLHETGIPLNVNAKFPHTKMKIALKRKKHPETGMMNAVINLTGTDYLSDVEVADNSTAGTILYDTLIHPRAFPTTRIAAFAGLFDKYVYNRFTVKYNPDAAATEGGQMIGFCDYDPDEDMVTAFRENIRKAASHFGMSFTQMFKKDNWSLKELKKDGLFYCEPADSEDRLVFQGRFILLQAADENADTFKFGTYGILTCDYDIDFYIPQLADTPVLTTNAYAHVDGDLTAESNVIPFGLVPTYSPRNNMNISYALETIGGTANKGVFYLPEVATTTMFMIIVNYVGVGIAGPVLQDYGGNTITAGRTVLLADGTKYAATYFVNVTTDSSSRKIVPAFSTITSLSVAELDIAPIPTAIALQHNNRKEITKEVDELKKEMEEMKEVFLGLTNGSQEVMAIDNNPTIQRLFAPSAPANPSPVMNRSRLTSLYKK